MAKAVDGRQPLVAIDDRHAPAAALPGDPGPLGLLEPAGAEQEVAGAERVPLAPRIAATRASRASRSGGSSSRAVSVVPSGLRSAHRDRRRGGRDRHDILGGDQPGQPLAELGEDRLAVLLREPVLLVQRDDQSLPLARHLGDHPMVGPGQVLIDNEDEQVGPQRQVHGLGLAGDAIGAGLAEAGRIGQEQRPFDAFDGMRLGPTVRGRPHRRPRLAGRPAEQGIDQRRSCRPARCPARRHGSGGPRPRPRSPSRSLRSSWQRSAADRAHFDARGNRSRRAYALYRLYRPTGRPRGSISSRGLVSAPLAPRPVRFGVAFAKLWLLVQPGSRGYNSGSGPVRGSRERAEPPPLRSAAPDRRF